MPTVAPPASAAGTLTAALSATASTGTPAATDALAGLFQSVLAQVVSQTTTATADQQQTALTDVLAQATSADGTANADLLAGLLALTEGEGEGDETPVNADLLSQLLAALGGNAQTLAQLQQAQPTTDTPAGFDAAALLAVAPTTTTAATSTDDADLSPAIRQVLDRTGFTGQVPLPATATEQTATANTPTTNEPTAPVLAQTITPEPVVTAAVPQAVTVADANKVAGRVPAVVVQPSILPDRGQLLPAAAALEPALVPPPVAEIQAVKAAPAVAPGQPLVATQQPDIDLPIPGTAVLPTDTAKPAFTLPTGATLTVTKTAPTVVQPTAAPVAPLAPVATPASTPTVPVSITPAAPGITAAVAQPVPTTPTVVDPLAGFAQLVSARAVPDDRFDLGSDPAAVASGLTIQRGEPAATPTLDRPIPAASQTTPAPVSDQLTAPILTHVQARPDAGETELRVRLDPPELGTVKVKIVSTGTDVRAELQVTSEAVRRVVESQLPELRQKLDDAGVRVQRMDVTTNSGGANAGTGRDDRPGRWQQDPDATARPLPTGRPVRQATPGTPRNRIDVTA